jgi:cytochrome c oxidase cbb3-type subunit III
MKQSFALLLLCALCACQREKRELRAAPATRESFLAIPNSELHAGGAVPSTGSLSNPYEGNAWAVNEGERLFSWFNCTGCHAHGGGGIGPPLNDQSWIYGGESSQIFETIVKGRPNGMPTWRGRIPDYQVWQLVTYVRSLANQQPKSATPARSDHIETNPAQPKTTARDPEP